MIKPSPDLNDFKSADVFTALAMIAIVVVAVLSTLATGLLP